MNCQKPSEVRLKETNTLRSHRFFIVDGYTSGINLFVLVMRVT